MLFCSIFNTLAKFISTPCGVSYYDFVLIKLAKRLELSLMEVAMLKNEVAGLSKLVAASTAAHAEQEEIAVQIESV
jgi:hypothetical protein